MKIFLILMLSLISLFGCSSQEVDNAETDSNPTKMVKEKTEKEANPDYRNMFIVDIKESIIVIAPHAIDEASYPVYEIYINKNTSIEGSKEKFDELSINDDVKVWVKDTDDDKEIAEKLFVHE
ncbi:hypothetical protein NC661_16695 [Aquibacillus koreensis]|uniref:DUF3221 domain-containing protein n=1 Tax=Aquibacillus koreensis TaxID=279446 RepID=A0A9X3WLK8_9BACI|nr:hypothetical protein [Aquibacillus koreensis]MCT2536856.1 hypothetical protein [Aquibacillus koreensis]MDC3422012.1 hypothetical protein [Aquibacillus koreensis]